ncbi:putative type IX secretion system sortase PorU2 [Dyadobacter psychrotolerans]|uniref:Gingipain domain-containing protein n=1 Tax=Dyadobacter psychrotolerans TaxID=2541721 RepID=A0A4R5DBL2_9BACT|nr:C25 family cysteine peptidase [Dyadobacter psychrotolerans]TDE11082.1 hypothetical protein E0F88_26670 [Dyadobacter psychrotolerans]
MNLRTLYLIIITTLMFSGSFAQKFTNSWIKYNQPYIKLSVKEKGIQRVSLDSLSKNGFPVSQTSKYQLFNRGKQVDIIGIEGNALVFYGEPNDGGLDSVFYRPITSRLNPYFSYYTDLGSYILTVSTTDIARAQTSDLALDTKTTPEKYHLEKTVILANTSKSDYSNGPWQIFEPTPAQSYFADGETMTGPAIIGSDLKNYDFQLNNWVTGTDVPNPILQVMVNGRNTIGFNINLSVGSRIANNFNFQGFKGTIANITLNPMTDIAVNGKGNFSLQSTNNSTSVRYSLTYHILKYPQSLTMAGRNFSYFNLTPTSNKVSRVVIKDAPKSALIFDVSDPSKPVQIKTSYSGADLDFMVTRVTNKELKLFVTNESKTVQKVTPIVYKEINPQDYNYIIVTASSVRESAEAYSSYRKSAAGGSFKPYIIDIKDVYDQFSFGEPHPAGIRNFADFFISKGGNDKYLLLIGKHLAPTRYLVKEIPDEVPSVGFPGSDVLLVSGLANTNQDVEAIPVGRISASTNELVYNYLDKVKEYEAGSIIDRKNVLHLNGGKSSSEISQFRDLLASLTPLVQNAGGEVKPFVKQTNIEVEPVVIAPEVNAGVGLISYFGHGSPTVTDLDFGYVSKSERGYQNKSKYPLMYFNGCGVGNIFNSYTNPLSTDWVLTKDKGAIAVIANSHLSYYSSSADYIKALYAEVFSPLNSIEESKTIGHIHQKVAANITKTPVDVYMISNLHQALLQGDPALKISFNNLPDYTVANSGIFVRSKILAQTIEKSDSLIVKINVSNVGKISTSENLNAKVTLSFSNGQASLDKTITKAMSEAKGEITFTIANNKFLNKIGVILDPANLIKESGKENNSAELIIPWENIKSLNSYPEESVEDFVAPQVLASFNNQVIENKQKVPVAARLTIRLTDNNTLTENPSLVQVYLKSCWDESCEFVQVNSSQIEVSKIDLKTLLFSPDVTPLSAGQYELLVRSWDMRGNTVVEPYRVQFELTESDEIAKSLIASPNPSTDYIRFKTEVLSNNNEPIESNIFIYDTHGRLIKTATTSFKSGNNEWYWYPKQSGSYIYKFVYYWKDGRKQELSGKVSVVR